MEEEGDTVTSVNSTQKEMICLINGNNGHWANQCQAQQYSQPNGGTPQYEYNTYPPPQQDPPQAPPHSDPHQNSWHQAPGSYQMPQQGCPGLTAGDSLCSKDLFLEPLVNSQRPRLYVYDRHRKRRGKLFKKTLKEI